MAERNPEAAEPVVFSRAGARRGFVAAQPLAVGVLLHGITFGLLALGSGLSVFDALLMSATVYSGTAQLAAVSAMSAGAGLLATLTAVVLLNARYLLYGATLRPWLGRVRASRAYSSLYFLGDGNWLLSMRAHSAGERDAGYVFGSGLAMFVPWLVGTLIGAFVGHRIPSPKVLALDFLLVSFCAAMAVGMLRGRSALWPAVAAFGAAALADRLAPPGWSVVAAGAAGAVAAWALHDGKREATA